MLHLFMSCRYKGYKHLCHVDIRDTYTHLRPVDVRDIHSSMSRRYKGYTLIHVMQM